MRKIRSFLVGLAAAAGMMGIAGPADALTFENHLRVKVGVSAVLPDESATVSTLGGTVDISDEYVPSAQIEWMFTEHISAELLCCVAAPDVTALPAAGGSIDLGDVSAFVPTLTVKYRWNPDGAVQPYVGAGVNYTVFYDEDPGAVASIDYDSSFGPAVQVGIDFMVGERAFVNLDVRHIWINSDVSINGGAINADVDINPTVVTAAIGWRF